MIPQVDGETGGITGEGGDDVALKCLDVLLRSIAAVGFRRDKLELDFPILCHDALELGAGFVIKDLQVKYEALGGQALHD